MNKHFSDKLILDEINLKTLIENKQKISAFSLFKNTFLGQLWNMVKANWLTLVFCIPLAAWLILAMIPQGNIDKMIPYSGNLGIGAPPIDYSYEMGLVQDFYLAMQKSLIMLPLIIIACLGFAGTFNVIKYNAWGMQVKIVRTFFRGVKNSFAPFVFMGMLLGVCYVLMIFSSYVFDVYSLHIGLEIAALILVSLISALVIMLCVYVFPQAVVFDLSIWAMLKNSFILSFKFIVQSLIITVIGAVSIALLFLTFNDAVQMVAMMIFFMVAFSYMACVWTIYNHHVFEVIDEIRKTNTPVQIDATPASHPKKKKLQKQVYQNPKKKKRN